MKTIVLVVGIAWVGLAGLAQAITPASPQQILCSSSSAVVGTIIDARSHDCRLRSSDPYCYNLGIVGVTIRVDEVLSPQGDAIAVGDTVHAATQIHNGPPIRIGDKLFPMNDTRAGWIGFPATGKGVTDAEARRELVGKQFLFAISPVGAAMNPREEPFFTRSYAMDQQTWVRDQWSSYACLRWRRR